jgi:hypothetical protein
MKRTLSVLVVAVVALLSLLGTATAEPSGSAGPDVVTNSPVTVHAPVQDGVSPLALSCPSGDLCVWPVSDGSSSRCSWLNADPDWQGGSVTCSWSSSRAVNASYNHGTSSSYAGVCMYPAANYGGNIAYFLYQGQSAPGFPGVRIRSHKWVTTDICF